MTDVNMMLCLEQCTKCDQAKELVNGRKDIIVLTFPHELNKLSDIQKTFIDKYGLMEDLQKTAPIFITADGKKLIGYLRIRKWVEDGTKRKDQEIH